jgi:thioredoxin reductase
VIIGAGVAGVSAALWMHDYGLSFGWIADEDARVGGILHRVNNPIHNAPPTDWEDGRALAAELARQVSRLPAGPRAGRVARVTATPDGAHLVELGDGSSLTALTVILATGTAQRTLGVPGEAELMGERVSTSGTRDGARFAGEEVAVVGGGDGGFENALILAERQGCRVRMLLRSEEFRARDDFVARVRAHDLITIAPTPTTVQRIERVDGAARLHLDTPSGPDTLEVACLFIKIGFGPRLPELEVSTPTGAYLPVDAHQRTDVAGLFAAGDVTAHPFRAVSHAAGQGARAAFAAAHHLGFFGEGKEELG